MKTIQDLRDAAQRHDFTGIWMWVATGEVPVATFSKFMIERDRSAVAAALESAERDAARQTSQA